MAVLCPTQGTGYLSLQETKRLILFGHMAQRIIKGPCDVLVANMLAVVGEIETLPFLRHPWGQNNRGLFSRTLEAAASKPLLKQLPPLNYCRHRQSHLKETRPLRWTWFNSRQHRCRSIVASDSSSTKEQKYTSRKQQAPLTEVGFLLTSAMQ
ncbi:hypothetical protein Zm00014a_028596 [Zea mays]|uniref:Uncharacterized protein n=2 Tax=Zea mays TaxID=4577 RepID=A0A8J8XC58_MAIZE|nr:hypothetical protein ZEAMMB73_Zm00001d003443 [Zea mays]PWZ36638.1 hypothetical protein Zm00014a_028596 [Zea mays]